MEFLKNLFGRTWAQILLTFLVGTALSFIPSEHKYYSAFHHIGIGLLVAAVVTLLWHLREFTEFFEKFARSILIDDEYLNRLSSATLSSIRSKAGRAILRSRVNNEHYNRDKLSDWIDEILYEELLPGGAKGSGTYREDYDEHIFLEQQTLAQAREEVGADAGDLPAEALSAIVHKVTTQTSFKVIAPRVAPGETYDLKANGRMADMDHFPIDKRIAYFAGHSQNEARRVAVIMENRRQGGVDFHSAPFSLEIVDGECLVWTQMVEYRSPHAEAHVLNTMNIITRGLNVDLTQTGPGQRLAVDGGVLAIGAEATVVNHTPFGIQLDFDGWLFKDHGYCIWWWKRAEALSGGGPAPGGAVMAPAEPPVARPGPGQPP